MQLEDKIRFALSTSRPMAAFTFPYVASILGVTTEGQQGVHVGSGLRCILGGRRAIVTAFHVLDQAMGYSSVAVSAGFGAQPYLVAEEVRYQADETVDLAVYFLPDDYPQANEAIAFWPEERIDRTNDHRATDYLFVHGFPKVDSSFSEANAGLRNKSFPYGVMERLDLRSELGPFQFALDFDPKQIKVESDSRQALPDPHGLSGSPVWRIGASGRSAREWKPDWSLLVGIVTQWREPERLLVATEASRIAEIVREAST